MGARYIDADKALEVWKDQDYIKLSSQETKARIMLDAVPSADVVEVRHAKDVGYESSYGWKDVCSLCGCEFGTSKSANYCPNCGARIDGEEQENE